MFIKSTGGMFFFSLSEALKSCDSQNNCRNEHEHDVQTNQKVIERCACEQFVMYKSTSAFYRFNNNNILSKSKYSCRCAYI